jgi:hypothetical protein
MNPYALATEIGGFSLGASWLLFCRHLVPALVVFRNSELLAFYASRPVRILGPLLASDRNRSPPS